MEPSQTAPNGAASSPKGRAKVASLRTMSNKIPFIGTPSRPTWREANSLPYGGLSKNLPAKLQFVEMLSQTDMHIVLCGCLVSCLDGGSVGAVAKAQDSRQDEQCLDAQSLPDPAAEEGDEDRNHMVDGNAGGDGGADLLRAVGDVLDIDIGCHGSQRNHAVQNVIHAADIECDVLGEQMVGKAIEEADDDQNQGVRHHDHLIAQPVDELAHNGGSKEAAHRRHGKQQADGGGSGAVEQDQHIGAEGEKDLLPGAVEHLQQIVLGVLLPEIEPPLIGVGPAAAGEPQGYHRADQQHGCRRPEKAPEGRHQCH